MLPPLTMIPPQFVGNPTSSAIQRTVCRSISVPAGESANEPRLGFTDAASMSARAPIGAADDVMYPKNRGCPLNVE